MIMMMILLFHFLLNPTQECIKSCPYFWMTTYPQPDFRFFAHPCGGGYVIWLFQ